MLLLCVLRGLFLLGSRRLSGKHAKLWLHVPSIPKTAHTCWGTQAVAWIRGWKSSCSVAQTPDLEGSTQAKLQKGRSMWCWVQAVTASEDMRLSWLKRQTGRVYVYKSHKGRRLVPSAGKPWLTEGDVYSCSKVCFSSSSAVLSATVWSPRASVAWWKQMERVRIYRKIIQLICSL